MSAFFLAFSSMFYSCVTDGNQGNNQESAKSAESEQTKTSDSNQNQQPNTNKKVLIIPSSTYIKSDLFQLAAKYIEGQLKNVAGEVKIEENLTTDAGYDKVLVITSAIAERVDHYFSTGHLDAFKKADTNYIAIAVQKVALEVTPNKISSSGYSIIPIKASPILTPTDATIKPDDLTKLTNFIKK